MVFRTQASNVAALIGLNPYKKQSEILESIWSKRSPAKFRQVFQKALNKDIKSVVANDICNVPVASSLSAKALNVARSAISAEEIVQTGAALHKAVQDTVDASLKRQKSLESALASGDRQVAEQLRLAKEESARLQQSSINVKAELQKKLYTSFGTKREHDAITEYERRNGETVTRYHGFKSIEIGKMIITGGIDGMLGDDTILEVKNRTRRIFDTVPTYERVQVEIYMRMYDKPKAVLLQFLLQQREPHLLKAHVLSRDDELWNKTIVPRLQAVENILKDLCESDLHADAYAQKNAQEREDFVRCLSID